MKIKIVSDGTPVGTKVFNVETDEPLEDIVSVTWNCSVKHPRAVVTLVVEGVDVDVQGDFTPDNG